MCRQMGEEQLGRQQQVLMGRHWVRRPDQDWSHWQVGREQLGEGGSFEGWP